jgi:hypothetical protein
MTTDEPARSANEKEGSERNIWNAFGAFIPPCTFFVKSIRRRDDGLDNRQNSILEGCESLAWLRALKDFVP